MRCSLLIGFSASLLGSDQVPPKTDFGKYLLAAGPKSKVYLAVNALTLRRSEIVSMLGATLKAHVIA